MKTVLGLVAVLVLMSAPMGCTSSTDGECCLVCNSDSHKPCGDRCIPLAEVCPITTKAGCACAGKYPPPPP